MRPRRRPLILRALVPALCLLVPALPAAEGGEPTPVAPLPPDPAPMVIDPEHHGGERRGGERARRPEVDREGLRADLQALLRVRERVLRRLRAGELPGQDPERVLTDLARHGLGDEPATSAAGPSGPPIVSNHLEVQVQPFTGAPGPFGLEPAQVSAAIRDEPVEVIYRELVALRGFSLDDQQVSSGRRRVALHLSDVPWHRAMDRLLGQAGLGWRLGPDNKIVIYELARQPLSESERSERAERVLRQAAADPSDPAAAEPLYLLAEMYHAAGDTVLAHSAYMEVFRHLDRNDPEYARARPWVRRAMRGVGDTLMELEQFRDARQVYLNYLSTAPENDPVLPTITYQAALAARAIGTGRDGSQVDPTALGQAEDLLESLVQRFGDDPEHAPVVAKARLTLGQLLFDREKYQSAKAHLAEHAAVVAGDGGDRLQFLLAESDYQLAQQARREYQPNRADRLLQEARERYRALFARYRAQRGSGELEADPELYRLAAYRIGLTWQELAQPDHVRALLAFIEARQEFHDSPIEGPLLVRITRAYAELERREESVARLFELMSGGHLDGPGAAVQDIEQLLGDIEANLGSYQAPIKAKALFYIAQANTEIARRSPREREERLTQAIHQYQRVLDEEGVDGSLRIAAMIGLGRAALAVGDEERGVVFLQDVLTDREAAPRDVALAAKLLGDHFRAIGRYAEALEYYRADGGEVPR